MTTTKYQIKLTMHY